MSATHYATPRVLWVPPTKDTAMDAFARLAEERTGRSFPDYASLHAWSVADANAFWLLASEHLDIHFHDRATTALAYERMPGAHWFAGATLNYAEQVLENGRDEGAVAVIFEREDGLLREVTHGELRDLVGRARVGLQRAGVGEGDHVVALAPNTTETLALFLAAASLGAVWSSCSPDFGVQAVVDRFVQLQPRVMLVVDGYLYGGKRIDIRDKVEHLQAVMPTLEVVVLHDYLTPGTRIDGTLAWADFTAAPGSLDYRVLPFDHPLWVLFSSGTTGLPKGIVQGHGGITLEHLKMWRLHYDLLPGDRILWFTTTGWMMWNFLISGLAAGATIVLYDGSPGFPDLHALWALAARHRIRLFGTSAPFIHACMKAGIEPGHAHRLRELRAIGSTGAPLSSEAFTWIADQVGSHVQIGSMSGGTDVCTAFLGPSPNLPIWQGELSCAALGADVHSFDDAGNDLLDEVGELVITKPMPSMPLRFWGDPDGVRMHEAYFDMFPGVWRHGDWVRRTIRGSFVIYGRSDATLNRGGVRMGTADFYAIVESFPGILDSLVIDTTMLDAPTEGELLCFVVLQPGTELEPLVPPLQSALRNGLSPRHVPDRFIPVKVVPRTINGKKCEVPVKRILGGMPADQAVSRDALLDPASLDAFIAFARGQIT